jgi:hypothetical protein
MSWSIIFYSLIICLFIIFIEKSIPVFLCLAIFTHPNLPFPNSFPNSKSLIFSCFDILFEEFVETVYFSNFMLLLFFYYINSLSNCLEPFKNKTYDA